MLAVHRYNFLFSLMEGSILCWCRYFSWHAQHVHSYLQYSKLYGYSRADSWYFSFRMQWNGYGAIASVYTEYCLNSKSWENWIRHSQPFPFGDQLGCWSPTFYLLNKLGKFPEWAHRFVGKSTERAHEYGFSGIQNLPLAAVFLFHGLHTSGQADQRWCSKGMERVTDWTA